MGEFLFCIVMRFATGIYNYTKSFTTYSTEKYILMFLLYKRMCVVGRIVKNLSGRKDFKILFKGLVRSEIVKYCVQELGQSQLINPTQLKSF